MAKHLVLVAGNIGAGKTSLTERLADRLNWTSGFESVADNPYLPDFYADMKSWSFHLQVFFLGHRAAQHKALASGASSAIIDRSIYEDAYIFARALHELGNLNERDYLAYRQLYDLVVEFIARARAVDLSARAGRDAGRSDHAPRPRDGVHHHARLSAPARSLLRRVAGRF